MNKRVDLISREAVKKLLGDLHIKYYGDVILAVMDLPAVDAVEVVHAKWERYADDKFIGYDADGKLKYRKVYTYECSNCGISTAVRMKYCPNCGARMQGGSDE